MAIRSAADIMRTAFNLRTQRVVRGVLCRDIVPEERVDSDIKPILDKYAAAHRIYQGVLVIDVIPKGDEQDAENLANEFERVGVWARVVEMVSGNIPDPEGGGD